MTGNLENSSSLKAKQKFAFEGNNFVITVNSEWTYLGRKFGEDEFKFVKKKIRNYSWSFTIYGFTTILY